MYEHGALKPRANSKGIAMNGKKPAWRQKESDTRQIGSALQSLCSAGEAELLKIFFKLIKVEEDIEIVEIKETEYVTWCDFGNGSDAGYERQLCELQFSKEINDLRYEKKKQLIEIEECYPDLFAEVYEILTKMADKVEFYKIHANAYNT